LLFVTQIYDHNIVINSKIVAEKSEEKWRKHNIDSWDECYAFKNISAEKLGIKWLF
jgi:hypothetical protein